MKRSTSAVNGSEVATDTPDILEDPFSDPIMSASASSTGLSSAPDFSNVPRPKFYHSRRIRKGEDYKQPTFKKHPGEKWLWINPLLGFIIGLLISGYIIYSGVTGISHNYCPVLNEDFSSGALNPRIWTMEVEVGGFGYAGSFLND